MNTARSVPFTPSSDDMSAPVAGLSQEDLSSLATGQMQPGVSVDPSAQPTGPHRPEEPPKPEVPEKFRNEDGSLNHDALLKSYSELERKLGSRSPEAANEATTEETQAASDEEAANEADTDDPFAEFTQKFLETGGLEEADFEKLQTEYGVSRSMAEQYIAGQQALAAQAREQTFQSAGIAGQAEFDQIAKWAVENLSKAEQDAFDKAVQQGDPTWALQGLKARYVASTGGKAPNLRSGSRSPGGNAGYKSRQEFLDTLASEAYQRGDRDVHDKHMEKLRAMPADVRRKWLGGTEPNPFRR